MVDQEVKKRQSSVRLQRLVPLLRRRPYLALQPLHVHRQPPQVPPPFPHLVQMRRRARVYHRAARLP